jgi:hypothetical protein
MVNYEDFFGFSSSGGESGYDGEEGHAEGKLISINFCLWASIPMYKSCYANVVIIAPAVTFSC